MYFKTAFIFSLVASALALPSGVDKRNNHSKGVNRRAVLGVQDYSEFQVSDGVAGNALAEVLAKFPVSQKPTPSPLPLPLISSSLLTNPPKRFPNQTSPTSTQRISPSSRRPARRPRTPRPKPAASTRPSRSRAAKTPPKAGPCRSARSRTRCSSYSYKSWRCRSSSSRTARTAPRSCSSS